MQVICDCGKKYYLADGCDTQVCDRCGQKLGARGSSAALPRASGSRHPAAQDAPMKNMGKAAMTLPIEHLEIAGGRKSHARLGCSVALLIALASAVAADFYLNPAIMQPCGHVAKDVYMFGLYKGAHGCETIEAVRYLDRMRRAIVLTRKLGRTLPAAMTTISALKDSGARPVGPYEFLIERDFSLTAVADEKLGLPSFHLTTDGTLRRAENREAGPDDEVIHVFE